MRMLIFPTSALLTVTAGTAAKAHAFLDHAEPRVGSTVPTAPRELTLSSESGAGVQFRRGE
jgi:copper resistance protein C